MTATKKAILVVFGLPTLSQSKSLPTRFQNPDTRGLQCIMPPPITNYHQLLLIIIKYYILAITSRKSNSYTLYRRRDKKYTVNTEVPAGFVKQINISRRGNARVAANNDYSWMLATHNEALEISIYRTVEHRATQNACCAIITLRPKIASKEICLPAIPHRETTQHAS